MTAECCVGAARQLAAERGHRESESSMALPGRAGQPEQRLGS